VKGGNKMLSRKFVISNKYGFHLRPAQVMVEKMTPFNSSVKIKRGDGTEVNAKSLLGLMSLGLKDGETVEAVIMGSDEMSAMKTLKELFSSNFGENQ
jgi:phosphotransferase system HPr (HPr) family protein